MSIRIERLDDGVTHLWLGPAGGAPALDLAAAEALRNAVQELARDPDSRVILLGSEGKLFCVGGDIHAMHEAGAGPDRERLLSAIIDAVHEAVVGLRALPQPVIALVNGAAAGAGFSLAMSADIVLAADNSRFVPGYPGLATTSDGGLSHFLPQRVGAMRAFDLLLARDHISAAEAQSLGLVLEVAAAADLVSTGRAYAARLARHPVQVLQGFKHLLNGADAGALKAQLDREREIFLRNAGTPLFASRLAAFLQRGRA
ncbi:enoyl-CoA hydratase-related protein [Flagellatimonas centrodinii]|uniref:enoyl-CoA hydratase/isomerase family protein n=1 Tax=Flagellatimonas centrodinii TaxID=2806210 RepID=UPI001FEDE9A3|nr:enoyl-CoA hydratase-related protein [Flagellatimonas centrodinii]ULQ47750.1 enoyl-CoA hydratase-related protein [Flagellatimonas centrodinii]